MPEQDQPKQNQDRGGNAKRGDVKPELRKLTDLAVRYPDIGPVVASLAFKVGEREIGDRLVRMAQEGDRPSVEYQFVAAQVARREGRGGDALRCAVDALKDVASSLDAVSDEDLQRLLHLVRHGYAVALFDEKDVQAGAELAATYRDSASTLGARLDKDHFFRTLLAQSLWYVDPEAAEAEWDRAAGLGDVEPVWNARGTWYKDAEGELEKAERAYRKGLEELPESAMLLHNLAQVLLERAEGASDNHKQVRRFLNQADDLLRRALRGDSPRLRRHIHSTRDRLYDMRRALPDDKQGGPSKGKGGPHKGKSGGKKGQPGRGRSRGKGGKGDAGAPRGDRFQRDGSVSLGEALMHKLQEQAKNK